MRIAFSEVIVPDSNVLTRTAFVPALCVVGDENSCHICIDKFIVFYYDLAPCGYKYAPCRNSVYGVSCIVKIGTERNVLYNHSLFCTVGRVNGNFNRVLAYEP